MNNFPKSFQSLSNFIHELDNLCARYFADHGLYDFEEYLNTSNESEKSKSKIN